LVTGAPFGGSFSPHPLYAVACGLQPAVLATPPFAVYLEINSIKDFSMSFASALSILQPTLR
jgi:hypothetical protein